VTLSVVEKITLVLAAIIIVVAVALAFF
jgi:hypothetical protein